MGPARQWSYFLPLPAECWIRVTLARSVRRGVGQQPAYYVELVVAGPDLGLLFPPRFLIYGFHHLGVVLQDVGQALAGQHLAPQVVGLEPMRVGRVARAVVPSPG